MYTVAPQAKIDFGSGVTSAWTNIATFVPKFVVFLIILVVGYVIAKILSRVLNSVLERVGFDKAIERGGVARALESSKYDASDILAKLVFYAIMLFVLSTAFGVFGPNPISGYLQEVINYLPRVFVAIVIIVIAAAIAAGAKTLIEGSLGGLSYGKVLANIASFGVIAFGVIAALNQLQIATNVVNGILYATLAAVAGVVIVAVGGGGIKPMQTRWENTLATYDVEKHNVRAQIAQAPTVSQQADQARAKVRQVADGRSDGATTPSGSHSF